MRQGKPGDANEGRYDRERHADLEVFDEPEIGASSTGVFDHDEVRDRAEDRQVPGERARHRQGKPRLFLIGNDRHERLKQEHRGHVRDEIREHHREAAHHRDRRPGQGREPFEPPGVDHVHLEGVDYDEKARKHDEGRPINLVIHLLRPHAVEHQDRRGDEGDRRYRGTRKEEDDRDERYDDAPQEQPPMHDRPRYPIKCWCSAELGFCLTVTPNILTKMRIHNISVEDALNSLHSRPEGLTSAEAEHRLHDFGPNRVERLRGKPLWLQFLGEFTHFFAVILWVAAALAFLANWSEPGEGMGALGWAIIGVIVVNSLFSFVQVYRAETRSRPWRSCCRTRSG